MINKYDDIEILEESIEVLDYTSSNDLSTYNCEKISRSLPVIVPDRKNGEIEQNNNHYQHIYIVIIFVVTVLTLVYMIIMVI